MLAELEWGVTAPAAHFRFLLRCVSRSSFSRNDTPSTPWLPPTRQTVLFSLRLLPPEQCLFVWRSALSAPSFYRTLPATDWLRACASAWLAPTRDTLPMLVHIGVAVDPWLPLWWTAVVAWLVARAQFCVSRGCVGSARRRRSTCCWMASLRSRPRPLRPAALLHCLRGSRDASGPRTSVRCRPAASGSTLGASTSLLACGASAAPLGLARRRYGSSASMASQAKEP